MMRLIGILFLAFVGYLLLKSVLGIAYVYRQKQQSGRRIKERKGGEMAEDPVCHTYVPKSAAIQKKVSGKTFYFCGKECADAFSKDRT